jgi:hypothetical protein
LDVRDEHPLLAAVLGADDQPVPRAGQAPAGFPAGS